MDGRDKHGHDGEEWFETGETMNKIMVGELRDFAEGDDYRVLRWRTSSSESSGRGIGCSPMRTTVHMTAARYVRAR